MNTGGVHGLGRQSFGLGDLLQTGVNKMGEKLAVYSDPEFKGTLELCLQKWIFTFCDLRDASESIGEKLHASANAVSSADNDSADQF